MEITANKIIIPEEDYAEIFAMLSTSFASGILTNGPLCREFENMFKSIVKKSYAVCTSSGTSALETALKSINVTDKEVIVPTNTNFATPAAVIYAGGKVKFVDCDSKTLSPSLSQLKDAITEKTAAIIIVHIGGIISNEIEEICNYCNEHNIVVIEDAAHAHGSCYKNKPAGSFGDIACFSFFPTKIMTCGEGGIVVTNNESVYNEAKKYINQGKEEPWINIHTSMGNSWRMTEMSAALGITQLRRLDKIIEFRRKIASIYNRELKKIGLTPHIINDDVFCNYYKYIVDIDPSLNKNRLKELLAEKNITLSGGVYEVPCHKQPVFQHITMESLEVASYFCDNHICLPIYNSMIESEINYIISSLKSVLEAI